MYKCEKRNASFIATWRSLAHFHKSISAPSGNLGGTIYEAGSSVSARLLGSRETAEADANADKQTRPHVYVGGKRFPVYFSAVEATRRPANASGGPGKRSARPQREPNRCVFTQGCHQTQRTDFLLAQEG